MYRMYQTLHTFCGHTGNTDEHTMGCLLFGDTAQQNVTKEGFIRIG